MNKTKRIAAAVFQCLMVVLALLAGSGLMAWGVVEDMDDDDE